MCFLTEILRKWPGLIFDVVLSENGFCSFWDSLRPSRLKTFFQGVRAIDWDEWLDQKRCFSCKRVVSEFSTLHSVPDCQKIIKKAVVERLSQRYKLSWFEERGPTVQVQFSIMKNEVMIMLDTGRGRPSCREDIGRMRERRLSVKH